MYHWMTQAEIQRFLAHLRREERSPGTLAKYRRDLLAFAARLPQGGRVDKEQVLAWKEEMARRYAPSTVNSMIAALNGFFAFQGWHGCRVKALRQQREIFREKARELDKGEYLALLAAARRRGSQRLPGTPGILPGPGYHRRSGVCDPHRTPGGPLQPVARDAGPLLPGRGGGPEGLPTQLSSPVCPGLLRPGQGPGEAGRPAGPRQHRDHAHLYYGERRRA